MLSNNRLFFTRKPLFRDKTLSRGSFYLAGHHSRMNCRRFELPGGATDLSVAQVEQFKIFVDVVTSGLFPLPDSNLLKETSTTWLISHRLCGLFSSRLPVWAVCEACVLPCKHVIAQRCLSLLSVPGLIKALQLFGWWIVLLNNFPSVSFWWHNFQWALTVIVLQVWKHTVIKNNSK